MTPGINNRFAILALATGLIAPLAYGETPAGVNPGNATPTPNETGKNEVNDKAFVAKAASGGMLEVKLGELAQQNASAADVKQFGQRMVDDHGKANAELKQLAQQNRIDVPTELKGEEKEHYDRLAKLNGAEFDQKYIAHMIRDHKEDIADFETEARDGKDAQTKAWAAKTLPTLQEHLKLIRQVAQAHGFDAAQTAGEKQAPDAGGKSDAGVKPNNQGNTGVQPQQPGTPGK